MEYKELIKNWHSKAPVADYFSKFISEYLAFIAYLKTQMYESADKDREAIQKLKQDIKLKDKYLAKIKNDNQVKQNWRHIIDTLNGSRLRNVARDPYSPDEIKWWNCSHLQLNKRTEKEKNKPKGIIHSLEDWENMVEFWHSIRNNLFHGAKNPKRERDQFGVEYGYKTLREFMEIVLNE